MKPVPRTFSTMTLWFSFFFRIAAPDKAAIVCWSLSGTGFNDILQRFSNVRGAFGWNVGRRIQHALGRWTIDWIFLRCNDETEIENREKKYSVFNN